MSVTFEGSRFFDQGVRLLGVSSQVNGNGNLTLALSQPPRRSRIIWFRHAEDAGVEIAVWTAGVSPNGITLGEPLPY